MTSFCFIRELTRLAMATLFLWPYFCELSIADTQQRHLTIQLGSRDVDVRIDEDSGEVSITNWDTLISPRLKFAFSDPGEAALDYCNRMLLESQKIVAQSKEKPETPSPPLPLRRLTKIKVTVSLFPNQLADGTLLSLISKQVKSTGGDLSTSLYLSNTLLITRIQTNLEWDNDALSEAAGTERVNDAIQQVLNNNTDILSQTGAAPLGPTGDDIACDLIQSRAKLSIQVDGRYPDKETRVPRISTREAEKILALVDNVKDSLSGDNNLSLTVQRAAVLDEMFVDVTNKSVNDLGLPNFVLLYRTIFDPDSVNGFAAAQVRYGRIKAVARALDIVSTEPQFISFEERAALPEQE